MRVLALLFSALLLVGACSDSSDDSDGSDDAPPGDLEADSEAAELLEAEGLLDDSGAISIGPAGPTEDDIQVALCDYLLGAPEDLGDRLDVDGLSLDSNSGYQNFGSNGTGIQCLYNGDDGGPVFGFGLWPEDPTEGDNRMTDVVTVDVPSGDVGFAGYHAEYDGEKVDGDTLTAWVEDAGSRYAGQSV